MFRWMQITSRESPHDIFDRDRTTTNNNKRYRNLHNRASHELIEQQTPMGALFVICILSLRQLFVSIEYRLGSFAFFTISRSSMFKRTEIHLEIAAWTWINVDFYSTIFPLIFRLFFLSLDRIKFTHDIRYWLYN